jgi:hypothetical protein
MPAVHAGHIHPRALPVSLRLQLSRLSLRGTTLRPACSRQLANAEDRPYQWLVSAGAVPLRSCFQDQRRPAPLHQTAGTDLVLHYYTNPRAVHQVATAAGITLWWLPFGLGVRQRPPSWQAQARTATRKEQAAHETGLALADNPWPAAGSLTTRPAFPPAWATDPVELGGFVSTKTRRGRQASPLYGHALHVHCHRAVQLPQRLSRQNLPSTVPDQQPRSTGTPPLPASAPSPRAASSRS